MSLISSGDDDPSDMEQGYSQDEVEFIGNSVGGGKATSTRLINLGSQTAPIKVTSDQATEKDALGRQQFGVAYNSADRTHNVYHSNNRLTNFQSPGRSPSRKTKQSRKRYSLRDDGDLSDELPRKMMRTEISNSLQVDGVIKEACPGRLHNSENLIGEALRIQQYSSSTRTNYKDDGFVREEISFILFRLPDGSRMQKPFVSTHPIKVGRK